MEALEQAAARLFDLFVFLTRKGSRRRPRREAKNAIVSAADPPSVPIPGPLVETRFMERPNRFLVRVELPEGEVVGAHLPDPGRLRELLVPGRRVWLRRAGPGERKTAWTAVLVETPDGRGLVSVDTTLPNRLIATALEVRALPELSGWRLVRAEVPIGGSRFDFLLRSARGRRQLLLEVKSVTLVEDGVGLFPDAVTARGARHVRELGELVREGRFAAAVLFVVQRRDAQRVRAAREIDPVFTEALAEARGAGVRVYARRCRVSLKRVRLGEAVGVE